MILRVPLKDTTLETLLWYCVRVLDVNGLKVDEPVTNMRWSQRLRYGLTVFLLVYYYVGGPINHLLNGENPRIQVGICLIAGGSMALNKTIWFYIYRYEIADICLQARIVEKSAGEAPRGLQRAQITSLVFGTTTVIAGIVMMLKPVFSSERTLSDRNIVLPGLNPPLVSPNYEISYGIIIPLVVMATAITCGYRMFFAAIVEFCAVRMRYLAVKLKTISESTKSINKFDYNTSMPSLVEETLDNKLGKIIIQHLEIKNLVDKMRCTYDIAMGLDFALIFATVCTLLIKMDRSDRLFFIQITSYVFGEIMMYCYCGQHLIDASSQLEEAAYACGWEEWKGTNGMRRAVVLIIQATQRPLKLTAARNVTLSYDAFHALMRGCYSIIAAVNAKYS